MARVIKLTRTWTLGRKLGEGGFGKVYEATDENGERAAAKLVRKLPGADREALIASELSGVPKIMPIIETGETPTDYVIVMPLAERSLGAELAARGAAIPVDEAVPILADIAEALVGMHAKEVISRDVKPLNVLLLGGAWHVSDFGIARYADSSTALHTFKNRGTEAYTAPERWRGERAKKASDIYSFGVLAHEVLAGELPFKGPNFGEQHLRATPPSLSNVPPRLASLVLESLDKSLDVRPNAANILSRLRALAKPPTPGGAALHAANQAISSANAAASAKKATAQSAEERRRLAFEGARARFRRVEETLQEALAEGSQVTESTVRTRTTGWSRSLGPATLFVEEVLPAKPGDWGHSGPKFEVFAYSAIGIRMPRNSQGWEGRTHSLWFCDAKEEGVFRWYETAFMDSPFARSTREVEPYALPPAQNAGVALSPVIGGLQVAWPFLQFDQGEEGEFLDRWLTWFGQAAQGRLHHPSSMPERSDAHRSWRK